MAAPAETLLRPPESSSAATPLVVLPERNNTSEQNPAEYCLVGDDGSWEQVRLREHRRFWARPGLYEYLVRELLESDAARTICRLLEREVRAAKGQIERLRVLDLGAGNGWLGGELAEIGVGRIFGIDRSQEAASAAERDNPGIYADYLVMDMRRLSEAQRDRLMHFDFSCLACVEPLAADEPPPNAFIEAFNVLAPGGWVAFHVHEDALRGQRDSRFTPLVQQMIKSGAISVRAEERYQHRLTTQGTPLVHVAFIGRKQRDFDPAEA